MSCGYESPDSNVQHFTKYTYQLETKSSVTVTLSAPNVAKTSAGEVGTWTMVYDEGFEVKIGGQTLFAFFAYEPKTVADLHSKKAQDYNSHCDRTMVGWYHSANLANWGCFRAQKKGVAAWSPPQYNSRAQNHLGSDDVLDPTTMNLHHHAGAMLLETGAETEVATAATAGATMFVADHALIEAVNTDASSLWQAGVPTELEGKTEQALLEMSGRMQFDKTAQLVHSAAMAQHHAHDAQHSEKHAHRFFQGTKTLATTGSYIYGPEDPEMEKANGVPASLDWRAAPDARGQTVDYTAHVRSQGHCGSCYAFAAAAMAESRIRIASKDRDQVTLSPQQMMSCSVTNQGCMGGYPFLLAKHAHEQGFVPESCMPYAPKTGLQCAAACQDSDIYYSSPEYGYIGGYYGGSSEAGMMKELSENGPFVVALFAPRALFYYKSGILKVSKWDPKQGRSESHWQETNHATLVVGYGVDRAGPEPIKYWIVQNTWGAHWGDHGFFKIVRGVNECAIESMPIFFHLTPKVSRANLKSKRPQFIELEMLHRQATALVEFEKERALAATAEAAIETEHGEGEAEEESAQCVAGEGVVCPGDIQPVIEKLSEAAAAAAEAAAE